MYYMLYFVYFVCACLSRLAHDAKSSKAHASTRCVRMYEEAGIKVETTHYIKYNIQ